MSDQLNCTLCGHPMPEGEEMFKCHGYSCPCPGEPLVGNAPSDSRETMKADYEGWLPLRPHWTEVCFEAYCAGRLDEKTRPCLTDARLAEALEAQDTEATGARMKRADKETEARAAVETLLKFIGEDVEREGLCDTPMRIVRMYDEFLNGYDTDIQKLLTKSLFPGDKYGGMVVVTDIPFYSLCEHHLLPFFGVAHVGYLPNEKTNRIIGLSKLPRLVEAYARRLQVQEILTQQIVDSLQTALDCRGVIVVMEAEHLCMAMRGVEKPGTRTMTSALSGIYTQPAVRNEFFELLKLRRG